MEGAKEPSAEQKKAISTLKSHNDQFLKDLDALNQEFDKTVVPFSKQSGKFWEVANELEKAHSQYPLGPYAHYYFEDFEEATEPFQDQWDQKNPRYRQITREQKTHIEQQLPNKGEFGDALEKIITQLRDIVSSIIGQNYLIVNLQGFSQKYEELKEEDKHWWVPMAVEQQKYSPKSVVTSEAHLPFTIPYHRELMMSYSMLFDTVSIVRAKIQKLKQILTSINGALSFAKIGSSGTPKYVMNINDDSSDNSTKIGDDNIFGDAAIGKEVKLDKKE